MGHYVLDIAYRVEGGDPIPRRRCVVAGESEGGCRMPAGANAWGVLGVALHTQSVEGAAVSVRRLGIARAEAAGPIPRGAMVRVAGADGRVAAIDAPTASTGSAGSNNAIDFALRQPLAGNGSAGVAIVVSGDNTPLSASVEGSTLRIHAATSGAGAATSTASEVVAFVNADPLASSIVAASHGAGSTGAGIVAADDDEFAGGLDSLNRIGVAQSEAIDEGDLVEVLLTP